MLTSVHGNKESGFVLLRALTATGLMLLVLSSIMALYISLGKSIYARSKQVDSEITARNVTVYALLKE